MFVTKHLGSEELTIRQEIIPLIDELMTYLLKNEVSAELKKILSENLFSSSMSNSAVMDVSVQ
jgi:hypothetical protein